MKRKLISLLFVTMLTVAISGCTANENTSNNAESTKQSTDIAEESNGQNDSDTIVVDSEVEITLEPKAYEGTLPDDWKEMTFAFEGHEIVLGETTAEFMGNLGWIEDYDAEFTSKKPFYENSLDANYYANYPSAFHYEAYNNTNGNDFVWASVDVMNDTDHTVSYKDTKIYFFECRIADVFGKPFEAHPDILLPKGITWGSSLEEIIAAYGEYDKPGSMSNTYIWYIDSDIPSLNQYMALEIHEESGLGGLEISNLPLNMED